MNAKGSFDLLHPVVRRWVYKQGWRDLRQIQQEAIGPILSGQTDVVISAPTAGGKTEAVFLPACSAIAGKKDGFGILYVSPLKALINDQHRRLESLCGMLEMRVTPWHGDSPRSKKKAARRCPEGVLLITPESLEARLVRDAGWVRSAFASIRYVVIDEYHAFVGFERGHHLQSLLSRLEHLLGRQKDPVPRVALSATLSDMAGVLSSLRPEASFPCKLIRDSEGRSRLSMQMRGFVESASLDAADPGNAACPAHRRVADDLYKTLRGDSHLIFANSRHFTEYYTALLRDLCERDHVPNEFFAHHGSLAKDLRFEVESRMQKEELPTTAVCTMTLELGIDVGKVNSIAQVTAPHSVSGLRQRLGRSGRRGEPAALRMYMIENELTADSDLADRLRLDLLKGVAMVRLLLEKWYEPPDTGLYHFSTLLHQALAVIAQWGGVRADQLWALLCGVGPFGNVSVEFFRELLTEMGRRRLISQLASGELILADQGERLVNHFSFYAVFETPPEFRIVVRKGGKTLGSLPINFPVAPDQQIVFGGRRWKVLDIDADKKVIYVAPTKGGNPPMFSGGGMPVHDRVRQEMLQVYLEGDYRIDVGGKRKEFMDAAARDLFAEGLASFHELQLEDRRMLGAGGTVYLIPWMGDKVVNTLAMLLARGGLKARSSAGIIAVNDASTSEVSESLNAFVKQDRVAGTELARLIPNRLTEKYDHLLPEGLLDIGYGAKFFDVRGAKTWLKRAIEKNLL